MKYAQTAQPPRQMRDNLGEKIFFLIKWVFVTMMCLFVLYPIVYTILGSFKTNAELTKGGGWLPSVWHVENYYNAFVGADFLQYTLNSFMVAILVTILALVTSTLAGFILAKRDFTLKKMWMALYLSMMFVSVGSVTLYPMYQLIHTLGLHKNILGLVLILTGGQASNVFLIMGFVKAMPKELEEAAIIDGCSLYGVFLRIILPLTKPILAVVALFAFRGAWNDYITTLVMTVSMPKLQTLTVAVAQLKYSANAAAEWHMMLAGASIALIPILIVYLFAHKQFIGGLMAGSVKG